jgi:TPR repeat protein
LSGLGTTANKDEAFEYYKNAKEAGCLAALNNIGYCYESGFGVDKEYNEAFANYSLSAENGACKFDKL